MKKYRQFILYGIALALLLLLLKVFELNFLMMRFSFQVYAGAIALIFTGLGIWMTTKLARPKAPVIIEKTIVAGPGFSMNTKMLDELRISGRELEVLQLMAQGLSNKEIAGKLFVSVNTVKTHAANLFLKLEAERRTQAIEKGRQLSLIP
jgi:DNA-binding NarL/FixJ family response regulator